MRRVFVVTAEIIVGEVNAVRGPTGVPLFAGSVRQAGQLRILNLEDTIPAVLPIEYHRWIVIK